MKSIIKLWNDNFDKGVTIYQIFLMLSMIGGLIIDSQSLILFSMFNCLFGYFEPNQERFSIDSFYRKVKKGGKK